MKPDGLRVCFVGNMLGKNTGFITTQGQIVAELLSAEGYEVTCVSSKINRAARLAEIIFTVISGHRRFDAVVVEVYSGLSFWIAEIVSLLCRIGRLPLVLVLHGGNLPELAAQNPKRIRRVFGRAGFLVAPSEFLAYEIGRCGFEIRVIPNVLDLEKYRFKSRAKILPRLIWMRSFHEIYNPQMAIETLAELKKSYPAATLVMAGKDKGLETECRQLAKRLNVGDAVSFPGFLDDEKKAEEFSKADVYLNTNRIDNMPVSVLEAAAFGLPVVATRVGGVPFLIKDRENGMLCENENPLSMVKSVVSLLENPRLTEKISRNGRKLANRSDWQEVKKDWEKLFAEIEFQKSRKAVSNSKVYGSENVKYQ
jgi:glycosyltransferase involved in cell wall biosynthesis